MLTSLDGVAALRNIRVELQQDAMGDYPHGVLWELLVLYDVCCALGLTRKLIRQVLGSNGAQYVHNYIKVPLDKLGARPQHSQPLIN
ncbi:MAG: hypothetical protein AAF702_44325 [Chloroflexota bacterium]